MKRPPTPVWILLLLVTTAVLYPLGITLPSVHLRETIFQDTYSILSGVLHLLDEGQVLLGLAILVFSVFFPATKILILFAVWRDFGDRDELLTWLRVLGKWSMLDVYVVAILVTAIELGLLAQVESRSGIFVFAASVIAALVVAQYFQRQQGTEDDAEAHGRLGGVTSRALTLAAVALFIAGSLLPLMTVEKWFFWSSEYSVVSSVFDLFGQGEAGLAVLVLLLVVVFPVIHLGGMVYLRFSTGPSPTALRQLRRIEEWAMLDVYVLSLALVLTRLGGIASVEPRPGLWLLFTAGLLALVDRRLLHRQLQAG